MPYIVVAKTRIETPERWLAALQRAFASDIHLYQIAGTGEVVVTSQHQPETAYRTDGTICDCAAHSRWGDPVCAHRAIYRYRRGLLSNDSFPLPDRVAA